MPKISQRKGQCFHTTTLYPTGGTEYWNHDQRISCDLATTMKAISNSGSALGNSGWKYVAKASENETLDSIIRNELKEE